MKNLWLAFCALGVFGLGGCAGVPVARYQAEQPVLDLAQYFNGTLDGWGMFQDRSGEVVKRFHVVIDAKWEKRDGVDVGTLDENFSWSDGTTSRRVWTITRVDSTHYVGRADDVAQRNAVPVGNRNLLLIAQHLHGDRLVGEPDRHLGHGLAARGNEPHAPCADEEQGAQHQWR